MFLFNFFIDKQNILFAMMLNALFIFIRVLLNLNTNIGIRWSIYLKRIDTRILKCPSTHWYLCYMGLGSVFDKNAVANVVHYACNHDLWFTPNENQITTIVTDL